MDQFTADYLIQLAAGLSANLVPALTSKLKTALAGDEQRQALDRALEAGVIGLVAAASGAEPHESDHLDGIFRRFFNAPAVGRELANILRGYPLDMDEMRHLFANAGYDAQTLPNLDFEVGMQAFQGAFLLAAIEEPDLEGIIKAHHLLRQTELQADLLHEMRKLVAALSDTPPEQRAVQAGSVFAAGAPVYNFSLHAPGSSVVVGDYNNVVQIVINQYISQHPAAANDPIMLRRRLQAYLGWLMTERENLSLRAISSGKTAGKELPPELSAVYVALNTRQPKRERDSEPLSALEAFALYRKIVLLGDPGSGKSTFVNHLAYCLAAHATSPNAGWLQKLPDWPEAEADRLPILVVLRDFARWLPDPLPDEANVTHLWDFIVQMLHKQKLDGVAPLLETALNEGRSLLLLDGLDEVTHVEQRRFVRDAVEAFIGRYHQNFLLVTCRILSYQEPDEEKEEPDLRLSPRYRSFTLADFNQEQRDDFVQAWYGELKRKGHLPGLDATLLSRDLQRAIRRSDLQRVAGNPLLLTVMAMVHVEKGELPDSRALLYDETIELLLSRWESTKDDASVPQLRQMLLAANRTDADLKTRLAEVAFTVHTQAGSAAAGDEHKVADIGETYLCEQLSRLNKKDLGWGQRLLEILKERAGLLIERAPGQFAFPHRTFQEYLAGVHLAAQLDFSDQAMGWGGRDVVWRPMVLFAVEHLVYVQSRPLDALNLISKLCPKDIPLSAEDWRFVWLAGEALASLGRERAEDSEWGLDLSRRVRWRLAALLIEGRLSAVERAAAGRVLAQLGDPRARVGTIVREDGLTLPDIAWGKTVPKGVYRFGNKKFEISEAYQLSRYPVTYAQFECFVKADDFADPRWWEDMPDEEAAYGTTYKLRELSEQAFPYANHPRERVSWYQAMAFCQWLNDKLDDGTQINLPHEDQWEVAARFNDGRIYPWGNDFDAAKANTYEGEKVGQTTPVGMYPTGKQPNLDLYDLSGNVWEWCRNKYADTAIEKPDRSGASRALRGGSWNLRRPQCARVLPLLRSTARPSATTRLSAGACGRPSH